MLNMSSVLHWGKGAGKDQLFHLSFKWVSDPTQGHTCFPLVLKVSQLDLTQQQESCGRAIDNA